MTDTWLGADWPAPDNIVAGTTLRNGGAGDLPAVPQILKQVHGRRVVRAGSADFDNGQPEADAIIANRAADICVVRTADCLPIMLTSADGMEIAAMHAGWRGLSRGIVEATVQAMVTEADKLIVWFGPAISQAAFEVGGEVRDAFLARDDAAAAAFVTNSRGRWQADLYLLARQRLAAAGVTAVHGGGLCTFADPERFFSYRRDGETGRLLSFVYRSS